MIGCGEVRGWGREFIDGDEEAAPECADLRIVRIGLNTSDRHHSSNSDILLKNLSTSWKRTLYLRLIGSYTYPKGHHRPLLFEFIVIAIKNKTQTASFLERMLSQLLAISSSSYFFLMEISTLCALFGSKMKSVDKLLHYSEDHWSLLNGVALPHLISFLFLFL